MCACSVMLLCVDVLQPEQKQLVEQDGFQDRLASVDVRWENDFNLMNTRHLNFEMAKIHGITTSHRLI